MEKFVLVDGYVKMNNEQLFINTNNLKKDVKNRGGWLVVFLTFVGISVFNNLRDEKYFEKIFHYFDFGLRILGMITIIAVLWYILFKKKSKKNLIINEIKKIEIDISEFETELTLIFLNKREKEFNFRTLENQVEPFINAIKKRNSRVEIKQI